MSERYTKLFSLPENLYAETSPVVIAAGALLKDNATGKVLAQIKFRNITCETIKALRVSVTPLDTKGAPLGEAVSHRYLDLAAGRNDEFGQKTPITLLDAETRAFSAAVTEIIYNDNTLWSGTDAPWETLPTPESLSSLLRDRELEKQYRLKFGEDCQYSPMEHKGLWYCACGALNFKEDSNCHKCRNSLTGFLSLDMDELKAAKDERLAAEAKKAAEEKAVAEAKAKKAKKLAAIIIPIVVVIIVAAVLVTQVVLPGSQYKAAEALLDAGEYTAAIEAFEALGDYKDSVIRAVEAKAAQEEAENAAAYEEAVALFEAEDYAAAIKAFEALKDYKDSATRAEETETAKIESENAAAYAKAEELLATGDYIAAYSAFEALGNFKDSIDRAASISENSGYICALLEMTAIGNEICFGTYEQDNNTANGSEDIEWIVLAKEDKRVLVVSKYGLDCQPYNTVKEDVTWESCSLRNWLNNEFLSSAFSSVEQAMIATTTVSNDPNPKYNTDPGNVTQDKIFLLSFKEVEKYNVNMQCEVTNFVYKMRDDTVDQDCDWWLRSPGNIPTRAAYVNTLGSFIYLGSVVTSNGDSNAFGFTFMATRPAMWIDLGA